MKCAIRDHVVINSKTGNFECKNCGVSQKTPLPCSIEMFITVGNQFKKEHKTCKPSVAK